MRICPSSSANLNLALALRGTLCRVTAKNASNAEKSPDVTVAIAVPTTTRMPALSWQLLSTAPRIITWPHPWEKRYFRHAIFDLLAVRRFMEVPGRGLEPLRISPPDPKSGASAKFRHPGIVD